MISVIVPIYKVEKYLPKCIDSLLNQTYRDLEIILVDDGSPDGCGEICDVYAARDNRIKVIHQANAGVSAARNAGLRVAGGEYIGFVDADDFCDIDMYAVMLEQMQDGNYDIVVCGYDYVDEQGIVTRPYRVSGVEFVSERELLSKYFDMPPSIRLGVANKIFRRSLLQDLGFTVGLKGAEDGEFLGKYIQRVHRGVIVHRPLYKNCERNGSATRGGLGYQAVLPALSVYRVVYDYVLHRFPNLGYHAQAYYLDACLLGVTQCQNSADSGAKVVIAGIRKRVRAEIKTMLLNSEVYWKTRVYYILFALGLEGIVCKN